MKVSKAIAALVLPALITMLSCSDGGTEADPCESDPACIKVEIPSREGNPVREFWRSAPGKDCPCAE